MRDLRQWITAAFRKAYAQRHPGRVLPYLWTLVATFGVYGFLQLLQDGPGIVAPESIYLLLILAVSLGWGLRLGLFASVLSVAAEHLTALPSLAALGVRLPNAITNLLVYVVLAFAVGMLASFNRAERLRSERSAEQEREASEYQRRMVGILAHDLKAPLTGARGYLELGRRYAQQGQPQRADAALLTSLEQVDRLTSMITDLVEASRIEQAPLAMESVAVGPLLSKCIRAFASDPRHTVTADVVAAQAIDVWADTVALTRILDNLLSNAVKYSPEGGPVEIGVAEVSDQSEGTRVRISVADRGLGIPVEERERIFAPYYRGRNQRFASGTGVGLYVCRELALKMGGTLTFEPRPDGGSMFRLELGGGALPEPLDSPAPRHVLPEATEQSVAPIGSRAGG